MKQSPRSVSKILVNAYPKCSLLYGFFIRWRPYICPFHELVKSVTNSRCLLEVGCGIGLMTILLAHLGKVKRAVGIDTSSKAINTACSAITPHNNDISFRCISEDDPWPDEYFDTILCVDVLHHIKTNEQRDFINKLTQTGNGSKIIFKDVSPKPFWKAIASILHDFLLTRQRIYIRDEEEVRRWFIDEGFSVLEYRRLDMLWYSHYLLVVEKRKGG